MQSLNILIACECKSRMADFIKNSKYINKIYTTFEEDSSELIPIKFNTFSSLAKKCKSLQIDFVLVESEKWILEGISNVMKQNFVTCFAPTTEWLELGLSNCFAREILSKYQINIPEKINLPVEFPVLVKGDGIIKIANNIQDVIDIKGQVFQKSPTIAKSIFIEKYLYGKKCKVLSLFDGKHLLTFPNKEVNKELLKEYSQKLEKMFNSENANFIGFINSELIEENGILYNTGFSFEPEPFFYDEVKEFCSKKDFVYICLSAIYQKLNEI